jgi:hypothetical protein
MGNMNNRKNKGKRSHLVTCQPNKNRSSPKIVAIMETKMSVLNLVTTAIK